MRKRLTKSVGLLLLMGLVVGPAVAQTPRPVTPNRAAADRRAILQALARQNADWNAGRIEKFMVGYWPSDSLTFVGSTGVNYGYAATLSNYKKRYPDRASMGTLKFDILELDLLSRDLAYMIGHWHLTRPKVGDADGHFTLVWRKIKGKWLIVSDHSS